MVRNLDEDNIARAVAAMHVDAKDTHVRAFTSKLVPQLDPFVRKVST